MAHIILLAIIVGLTILGRQVVKQIQAPKATVELIAPDIATLKPSKTEAGGEVVAVVTTTSSKR